ncbi:MAG: prolyl oligopeptidase family serine peptidase [Acidobacteriia bacterium]|nr:prolyl oligopeptidase family serine peptidase [Terriglobia bacterium]
MAGRQNLIFLRWFQFVPIACLIFLTMNVRAADPAPQPSTPAAPAPAKTEKWQVDDFIMGETASQFEVSPDGHWVVWVKSLADNDKDGRYSNLYLTSMLEKKEIQLTRGKDNHSSPKFSPNSQVIAFLSTRPDPMAKTPSPAGPSAEGPTNQLWLINPNGGEPWPITSGKRSVTSFDWANNDTIVFTAQEDAALYEQTNKEKKDTTNVVDDEVHAVPVRLYQVAIKTKTVTRLSDNTDDRIQSFALSHHGTQAVALVQRSLSYIYDQRIKPTAYLYDLAAHTRKQLFVGEKINPSQFHWTFDDSGFYVASQYSNDPVYLNATISLLYFYDVASGKSTPVDLGWENGLAGRLEITPDGFLCSLANGALSKLARYVREANGMHWSHSWVEAEHTGHIWQLNFSHDGRSMVYDYSTASTPSQWYRALLEGNKIISPVQITDLNPNLKHRHIAKSEIVHWKGALDEQVEGILYYPENYQTGNKYPLMLMIHGGPAGFDRDAWGLSYAYPVNLLTQHGAFVLRPNYHGSSGYGLKWVESIAHGKYYELEIPDIEKGVDALISRGLVDPEKLGTMGWSNGAILSIQLTVTTDRYKVCSAGAGDVDWTSDWGNAHFGASFDNYYFGKTPLEDPELYRQKSPFFKLDRVKTPTIIYFGTMDTNVPTQQGWLHYRALQQLGKTDVRFLLFPGEPHGFQKLSHQRRKLEEDVVWIDKYLFGEVKDKNEALKPNSPLSQEIRKKSIKKVGLLYGESRVPTSASAKTSSSILIPEVVQHGSVQLGRFEITRAQYRAFDKSYPVDAGTENYPANHISFDNAKAYCAWLNNLTGKSFRLPKIKELEALGKAAGAHGNTLDYWAGYSVNPDDARAIQKAVSELGGIERGALLKPVGSFSGFGKEEEDLVFDLDGNVAEWALVEDGSGLAVGASADTPLDPRIPAKLRRPAPAYIGFRVFEGPPPKDSASEGERP